eukprot:6174043-Pleurochrysis_carterae.AAC.1
MSRLKGSLRSRARCVCRRCGGRRLRVWRTPLSRIVFAEQLVCTLDQSRLAGSLLQLSDGRALAFWAPRLLKRCDWNRGGGRF